MSAEPAQALATDACTQESASFVRLFGHSMRAHGPLLAIAVVYLIAEVALSAANPAIAPANFTAFPVVFVSVILPVFLFGVVVLRFCRLAIYVRPPQPLAAFGRDLRSLFASPRRLANGLPLVIVLFLFIHTFSAFKASIPHYNPFSWDEAFMALDRALHFGVDPWVLLQPVLGFPLVTFAINFVYNFWFMTMWIIWMWLAFASGHSHLRLQFFLAFMLCWIVGGTIFATALSSAGPCYYGLVAPGPDPFVPLMDYLERVNETYPIWALSTQQLLWDGFEGKQDLVRGISAMPSMHNATAVLFALVGWRTNRTLGIVLTLFAIFILIGSVHLGWHYAVDGYFGALIAVALWWAAGRFITWYERRAHVRDYAEALERI